MRRSMASLSPQAKMQILGEGLMFLPAIRLQNGAAEHPKSRAINPFSPGWGDRRVYLQGHQ